MVAAYEPRISLGCRIRKSPFFASTLKYGVKVFTVYNHMYMPTIYADALEDYRAIIDGVTLWDVAGERQVEITGTDAAAFTQWITTRDLSRCSVGQCKYTLLTDDAGGVLNDPVLLKLAEDRFWLSVADSDLLLWCKGVAMGRDWRVQIQEPDVSPLQLQGPLAIEVAKSMFGDWVDSLKFFWAKEFDYKNVPLVISRTGWSGEKGFEIYLRDSRYGDWLWEEIMTHGEPHGIKPSSPSQIRRIEGGLISYGADGDLRHNPFEMNLAHLVDLDSPDDFIGRAALEEIHRAGVAQRLVGLVIEGEAITGNVFYWQVADAAAGAPIGEVKSAVYSPTLTQNIAMAMLHTRPTDYTQPGARVWVEVDGRDWREAEVCTLPFISNKNKAGSRMTQNDVTAPDAPNFVPLSPISFLNRTKRIYPDLPSVLYEERCYTWRDTAMRAGRLAGALRKHGLQKNDVVIFFAANTPELFEAHFGVPMAGGVLSACNIRLNAPIMRYIIEHSEAKFIVVDHEFAGVIREALQGVTSGPMVVEITDESETEFDIDYERFLQTADEEICLMPESESDPIAAELYVGDDRQPERSTLSSSGCVSYADGDRDRVADEVASDLLGDGADVSLQRLGTPLDADAARRALCLFAKNRRGEDLCVDRGAPCRLSRWRADRVEYAGAGSASVGAETVSSGETDDRRRAAAEYGVG